MLVCSLVARMVPGHTPWKKVAVLRLCVAFILHPQLLTPAPKHSYDCGQESHTSFWLSSSFFIEGERACSVRPLGCDAGGPRPTGRYIDIYMCVCVVQLSRAHLQ